MSETTTLIGGPWDGYSSQFTNDKQIKMGTEANTAQGPITGEALYRVQPDHKTAIYTKTINWATLTGTIPNTPKDPTDWWKKGTQQ